MASTASGATRTGRPRNHEIDQAVLDATIDLLVERGLHAVSMEEIASHAHTGKDTLYRRWPSKRHLVKAALEHLRDGAISVTSTGSSTNDLVRYLVGLDRLMVATPFGHIVAPLVGEAGHDAELAGLLATFWTERRAEAMRIVMGHRADRSTGRRSVELCLDMLFGALLYRWLVERQPVTERHIRHLVAATGITHGAASMRPGPPMRESDGGTDGH